MSIHDKDISKSINLNIIGTSNVVIACAQFNLKLFIFQPDMFIQAQRAIIKKMNQ